MPKIKRTVTRDLPNRSRVVAELELRLAPPGNRFCEDGLSPGSPGVIGHVPQLPPLPGCSEERQPPHSYSASGYGLSSDRGNVCA